MIRSIIFDCFGVLTSEGWQEFKKTHFNDNKSKLDEANKLNMLADQGKMNHDQLMHMIAELADISVEKAVSEIDDYQANSELFSYIALELKPKYKIGMLSNVSDDWLNQMFTNEQRGLFDAIALSFNTGIAKPDKRAYEHIAKELGVKMTECVFIDDREHYVDAARKYGMFGICYKKFDEFKIELVQILEMSDTDK